jgi:RNA polymerase sigma-70 factor (ECF subfamily)
MNKDLPSDTELLELARQFDPGALALIYDLYSPGLYHYSMRRLSDNALAEDCVAETFRRLLQALKAERGPERHLQAYLYRTAHNWISDHYRQEPAQPVELTNEQHDENANPEEEAARRIFQDALRMALRKLTPDQQQVITLKYLEAWENDEIALSLDKPVGAVKSLQHRALASLQKMLKDEELK